MSGKQRALEAINLEATDRIPAWELLSNPHFESQLTGINAYEHPQKARLKTLELLNIDMTLMFEPEKSAVEFKEGESSKVDNQGRRVVRWGAGGTIRWDHGFMFNDIQDVLKFDAISFFLEGKGLQKVIFEDIDPIQEYLPLSIDQMAAKLNDFQNEKQRLVGESALVPGWYYRTLWMWFLLTFGWEASIELALLHKGEFCRLRDEFLQISKKVMKAYSMTDVKMVFSHDDICITQGSLFNPSWYHENLYSCYEEIWNPLKEKRIKVVFVSDGNQNETIDDVISAGADGFWCECYTDMERFAKKYRDGLIMLGNVDSRILQLKDKQGIRQEVERCTRFGKTCPGYFYCASGHLTWNIPPDNIKYYFQCCDEVGRRD